MEGGVSILELKTQLKEASEKNQELRMKYPEQPQRFFQSEDLLYDILQRLTEVEEGCLEEISRCGVLELVLTLLSHPNSQIAGAAVEVCFELLCEEPSDDAIFQERFRLIGRLLERGLLEGVVAALRRMDEEGSVEEFEIALQALRVILALCEASQAGLHKAAADSTLLEYLVSRILPNFRIPHKALDDNKFAASDILACLLPQSQEAVRLFAERHGAEALLEAIMAEAKEPPTQADQVEFLGNILDCLIVLLIEPLPITVAACERVNFQHALLQLLRAKHECSLNALKAIASGVMAVPSSIQSLIHHGVFRYLFVLLQHKGLKGKDDDQQGAIDEQCLIILYAIAQLAREQDRHRLRAKLAQKSFGNLVLIFKLRQEYALLIADYPGAKAASFLTSGVHNCLLLCDKIILVLFREHVLAHKLQELCKLFDLDLGQIEHALRAGLAKSPEGEDRRRLERLLSEFPRVQELARND